MNGNGQPAIVDNMEDRSSILNGNSISSHNKLTNGNVTSNNGNGNVGGIERIVSSVKTGPSAFKRPTDFLVLCLKHLFIAIVHIIVFAYTYLTLPIYYFVQKPCEVVDKANLTRSKQLNPKDPHSPWHANFVQDYPFVLDKVETLDEMIEHLHEYFSLDRRGLGSRRVLREHVVTAADGKTPLRIDGRTVKKRELSDYEWVSYRDMITRRKHIARGLSLAGVERRDKLVILCETSVEYLLVQLAIAHAGFCQVNVFSTLGDSGIAHAVKETEAKFIFTSYELLPKVRSIIESYNLNIEKVFYVNRRVEEITKQSELECQELAKDLENTTFVSLSDVEANGELNGQSVADKCKALPQDEIGYISKYMSCIVHNPSNLNFIFSTVYTSGTTGVPKGVQATSNQFINLLRAILPVLESIVDCSEQNMYVAYLPQAHIFEATCELLALALGAPIGFANPFTLTDSAPGLAPGTKSDLRLLQPTIMIAVPLVLERMRKEIYTKLEARSPISAPLFNYLMDYKIRWTKKGKTKPSLIKFVSNCLFYQVTQLP